jgi:hypothetical protein
MAAEQERGGAAFGALMAQRVRELEQERGETITPAQVTRWVFRELDDETRAYDQQQATRVLKGERAFPDTEEVDAWCRALLLTGERRARAFWTVGLLPPEVDAEQLAAAMNGDGGASKRRGRHLSTYRARPGATTGGRNVQRRRTTTRFAPIAAHSTSHADLSAILCHGERLNPAA